MSDGDTGASDDESEMVQISLQFSKSLLEDLDTTWEQAGFNSRDEFLRYAARDAVEHPAFSRDEIVELM